MNNSKLMLIPDNRKTARYNSTLRVARSGISPASASPCSMLIQHRFAFLNLRPSLRFDESQEELSRFTLQTKNCFPYSPPAARRARSNGEALVAKGEMHKAGQATGAPCACKRTYTERCKSAPYEHGQYVAEPNCVARRRGGEQGDAKWQSVGYELDSA